LDQWISTTHNKTPGIGKNPLTIAANPRDGWQRRVGVGGAFALTLCLLLSLSELGDVAVVTKVNLFITIQTAINTAKPLVSLFIIFIFFINSHFLDFNDFFYNDSSTSTGQTLQSDIVFNQHEVLIAK